MPQPAEEKKLYKIGEVCRVADVQPYVLRYWETEFPPLAPNKSGGGQRPTRSARSTSSCASNSFSIGKDSRAGAKKKTGDRAEWRATESSTTPPPPSKS